MTTSETTEIRSLLDGLGSTPEEVVAKLDAEKCYGPRNNEFDCPVGRYLSKHTGLDSSATSRICMTGTFTRDENGIIDNFIGAEWAQTPAPVAVALDRFDDGQYGILENGVV